MQQAGRVQVWMKRGRPNTLSGISSARHARCRRCAARRPASPSRRQVASRAEQGIVGQLPIAGAQIAGPDDRAVFDRKRRPPATPSRCGRAAKIDGARLGARRGARRCRNRSTERLPEVTPSLGLRAVVAGSMRTRPMSTSSSSAAICAKAVRMPWPISTLPGVTSTKPSARIRSHRDRRGLARRLTGSCGRPHGGGPAHAPPSLAARSTARTMRLWAPQRHRLRSSAARTSASLGSGLRRQQGRGRDQDAGDAIAALHGLLGDEGASAGGAGCSGVPRPSMVVTCLPAAAHSGVSQAATAWPSMRTLQAPHWLTPQPKWRAGQPEFAAQHREQRRAGSASTARSTPLTLSTSAPRPASLICTLMPARLNHLGPFLDVVAQVFVELGRRHDAAARRPAWPSCRLHLGQRQHLVDLGVELVDDRLAACRPAP